MIMAYGSYNGYKVRRQSALITVLKALIPYSHENLMLAYKPNAFFNELEKTSSYKRKTLENAMRQAETQNMIKREANLIRLTDKGHEITRPFVAKKLPRGARLMVIFDIPEDMAVLRARFRRILQSWKFEQIQKSVWVTDYDHKSSIKEIVDELELHPYVILYECAVI